eukprot:282504-Chlamydomonas_euryale.AAC.1
MSLKQLSPPLLMRPSLRALALRQSGCRQSRQGGAVWRDRSCDAHARVCMHGAPIRFGFHTDTPTPRICMHETPVGFEIRTDASTPRICMHEVMHEPFLCFCGEAGLNNLRECQAVKLFVYCPAVTEIVKRVIATRACSQLQSKAQFTALRSPPTAHRSPLTAHRSPLSAHHLTLTI